MYDASRTFLRQRDLLKLLEDLFRAVFRRKEHAARARGSTRESQFLKKVYDDELPNVGRHGSEMLAVMDQRTKLISYSDALETFKNSTAQRLQWALSK